MNPKYPVYIVSKGRHDHPLTANFMKEEGIPFKILVEAQEYKAYCESVGEEYVLELPFSNKGLGSYPARNFAWKHSIENGHDKHWIWDDNIRGMRRLHRGKRIPVHSGTAMVCMEDFASRYTNVGISGFNYTYFVTNTTKKALVMNVHVYSSLLIDNSIPFRWRLKYNEDVDLCLQALHNGYCTVLFNALMIDKTSTVAKMKGGNQEELYKGNAYEKKVLKARSLEEMWPQYAETKMRFNRPHHYVNWRKHFKHPLLRNPNYDWDNMQSVNNFGMSLKRVKK